MEKCIAGLNCRNGWVLDATKNQLVVCKCVKIKNILKKYQENGFENKLRKPFKQLEEQYIKEFSKGEVEEAFKHTINSSPYKAIVGKLPTKTYETAGKEILENVEGLIKDNVKYVLFGEPGTGKSQFASSLAFELFFKGIDSYYLEAPVFSEAVFDYSGEKWQQLEDKIIHPESVKVLIIDDIGAEVSSQDKGLDILLNKYNIFIRRFQKKDGLVIITSNHNPFELREKYKDSKRIFDRIYQDELTVFYQFSQKNRFRQKQRSKTLDKIRGLHNGISE